MSSITSSDTKKFTERTEFLYKAIAKSQALIEFDLLGKVINANSIFLDLFGYKLEEIIGKHHSIFCLDGVKQTEEYQQFWEKLRAGVFEHGEFLRIDSHRKHIYIQASYNPVFNENNELISIIN